jgi:SNF2 family DNA or RNA helicase
MNCTESDGNLFIAGSGIQFLRLKTEIAARISPKLVSSAGKNRFSVPRGTTHLFSDILSQFGISNQEISKILNADTAHSAARTHALSIRDTEKYKPLPAPWKEVLDIHQSIAVSMMILPNLKGLCLFDEQGVGKTVTAISAFDIMKTRHDVECMIVVCPKSMTREWKKSIEFFLPGKYSVSILEGKLNARHCIALQPADVFIMNFETVKTLQVVFNAVANKYRSLLVVDESYYVKNPKAIRSFALRDLRRKCVRGFVLCGTPAPNSSLDLIHQFDVADDGYTFSGFSATGDPMKDRVPIEQTIENRGIFLRRLKVNVLPNLPAKRFQIIPVKLTGRQLQLYSEARNSLELWLRGMDNTTFRKSMADYFSKRQTLLQICVNPKSIDPLFDTTPLKYTELDKVLRELIDRRKKKVVIWSYYKKSIDDLIERYKKYGTVRLDGTVKGKTRTNSIERFQTDESVKLFIGNPAAAGAGITLHAASDAIYLSFPDQAAFYLQSLDRIHRRGQSAKSVTYHLLVCKSTIEEGVIQRLRNKEVNQANLLGDKLDWPLSIDEAIADLNKAPK